MKAGLGPLFIGRLLDLLIFPLFLIVIWFFMRMLFYNRVAFFAVLLGSSVYSFYLATTNFIPAAIAVILGLLSIIAEEKNKIISSSILLSLSFYAHAQIPWVFAAVFLIYGLLNKDRFKKCVVTLISGIILSLPIILYLFKNRFYYTRQLAHENFAIEMNIIIILSALAIHTIIKEKKRYYILPALAISVIPFIPTYPYRYISGQGLVGFILLAAVGIDNAYEAIQGFLASHSYYRTRSLFPIALIVIFTLFSPSICFRRPENTRFIIFNSTYINLTFPPRDQFRRNDYSIVSSKFIPELVKSIQENSKGDDIIFTNIDSIDTALASLSNRASARGMLGEIPPYKTQDPFASSRLVVWFKYYNSGLDKRLFDLVARNKLVKIKETEIASIYKNPGARSKPENRKPVISNKVIFALAALIICLLLWDLSSPHFRLT
ncbi:MAG: hypothetical protein NT066_01220, partial [Candidatus Omnitrophica bacterium]|nr:hypothetical protein [Candidatus Omnitrophota bacterium]